MAGFFGGAAGGHFNRYDPLPGITSPRPDQAGQQQQQEVIYLPPTKHDGGQQQRLSAMEVRVAALEQANRVLLDEVVQARNEGKAGVRRLEGSADAAVSQLLARVKRNEEQIQGGQLTLNGMVEQIRRLNHTVSAGNTNVSDRNDLYDSRLTELHQWLEEWKTERQQVVLATHSFGDKLRSLEQRIDSKTHDLTALAMDMKKRNLAVEDEGRNLVEQLRRAQEWQSETEYSGQQMKQQVENRLAEMQATVSDVRGKAIKDEADRRAADQLTNRKLNDVQFAVSDLQRSQDNVQHEQSKLRQDLTGLFETEAAKLDDRVARLMEDFRRRLHDSEAKAREELAAKLGQLERAVHEEREGRLANEKAIRDEMRETHTELRDKMKEDLAQAKKTRKGEKQKMTDSLNMINEGLVAVEKHQDEWFEKLTKSLRAEIKTRESKTEQLSSLVTTLDNKFGEALQLVQKEMDLVRCGGGGGSTVRRSQALVPVVPPAAPRAEELEGRVAELSRRVEQLQRSVDERAKETISLRNSMSLGSTGSGVEKIQATLNEVIEWYDKSTGQVDDVNRTYLDKVLPKMEGVERELAELRSSVAQNVSREAAQRSSEVEQVRKELERRREEEEDAREELQRLVSAAKAGTEQVAQSVINMQQSVRTSLDQAIYDLQLRFHQENTKKVEQLVQLRHDLNRLSALVEDNVLAASAHNLRTNYGLDHMQLLGEPEPVETALPFSLGGTMNQQPEERARLVQSCSVQTVAPAGLGRTDSPGTHTQTMESYLAQVTLTRGNPTRGVQTGKSVLDTPPPPPSPNLATQTSFPETETGVAVQTSSRERTRSVDQSGGPGSQERERSAASEVPSNQAAGMTFSAPVGHQIEMAAKLERAVNQPPDSSSPLLGAAEEGGQEALGDAAGNGPAAEEGGTANLDELEYKSSASSGKHRHLPIQQPDDPPAADPS